MDSSIGADTVDGGAVSASEPVPERPSAEALLQLDALDHQHLARMLRAEHRFPFFLWANLGVAVMLVIYYSWSGSWSGARAVLVLLILMGARSHLRHLRNARLLRKLSSSGTESR